MRFVKGLFMIILLWEVKSILLSSIENLETSKYSAWHRIHRTRTYHVTFCFLNT